MPSPLCIGHRGAAGHAPENTLASVTRALELGVDGIEIDVHCCKDALVVIHDPDLERTTNGHGQVSARCLAELQELDAGNGERIPTLDQVLDLLPAGISCNIELKGVGTAPAVVACLRHRDALAERPILVSSFDWDQLARVRKLAPEFDLAPITKNDYRAAIQAAERLDARFVNMNVNSITANITEDAHVRGLSIGAWTVNDADAIEKMLALEVDVLISDFPDRVRAAL